jgi:hypothetical protein
MKEDLKAKMERYGIEGIKLSNDCGKVVLKDGVLSYERRYSARYYINEEYAYIVALNELNEREGDIELFLSSKDKIYESRMCHIEYDNKEYNHVVDKFSIYKSDIEDSGVVIKDNNIVVGNINQLRKFKSYTNNHYRYCRCCDNYENEEVERLLKIGAKFEGLFEKYDSFMEYYHNAIVD